VRFAIPPLWSAAATVGCMTRGKHINQPPQPPTLLCRRHNPHQLGSIGGLTFIPLWSLLPLYIHLLVYRDYISFRHHVYTQKGKEPVLAEVGPRMEMKLYQIKLGTVDQTEADNEWVARPYMNTAKKRKFLGD